MITIFLAYSFFLLLFSWFVFRIFVRKDYENLLRLTPGSYILEILVFALHGVLLNFTTPVAWNEFPPLPESLILKAVSVCVFAIGSFILIVSWFGLGSKTSLGLDKNKLKTNGIYKISRNPQLLGYGMMLLAPVVLYFSWMLLAWLLQYMVISYFMIKSEEEFLHRKYGKAYEDYCKLVPRILRLPVKGNKTAKL